MIRKKFNGKWYYFYIVLDTLRGVYNLRDKLDAKNVKYKVITEFDRDKTHYYVVFTRPKLKRPSLKMWYK